MVTSKAAQSAPVGLPETILLCMPFPFMKIKILPSALTERKGKFYNAAAFNKFSTILLDNGNPRQENTE